MCKYFFIIIFVLSISCNSERKPELELSVYTYDFGKISRDSLYNGSAVIKNTGTDTLKISISADCSCTEAKATKTDIIPNDTSLLTFSYNTFHKLGKQENSIFITANTDSLVYLLEVRAEVY